MIFTTSAASTAYVDKPRFPAFGLIALLAFAQVILASSAAGNLSAAERPNILWLTCEDMGPHLGCYGDDYATTPTLDALAVRGMRYTNASSNAPVCAPARTTIISGLYAPSTGSEHMRSETRLPAAFRMFPQFLREAGYYCTNNGKEDYNLAKPGRVWDVSNGKAHWKNRREGQPFFAVFNNPITHESQIRNEIDEANQKHDPAGVRIPAYHPDTPEVRRDWAQYYDRITMMDGEVARRLKELDEAGLAEDTIVFFFSDHGSGMPRNKRWLYGSGLDVPMIVYFPPKWRHLAPKEYRDGGTSDRLVSFVDLAPTVLSMTGITPPSWMQGGAFAGEQQTTESEFSYGYRARMDERYDLSRSVRDKQYRYIRNYMPHIPYGQNLAYMFETPTTRVWHRLFREGKLNAIQSAFWQVKPTEELYDLKADPDEVNNLADSSEHASTLARLRAEHRRWEKEIKDVSLLSEWEMQKRSKGASPYEIGHAPDRYDFDSVFAAAEMASSRKADDVPALIELLKHGDSGVRYWAAVGLLAQEAEGVKAAHEELVAALEDESPIVRITAAEALGRFGDDEDATRALKVLLHYAGPDSNYYLCVAAWNALDFLDERARPALPAIQAMQVERENVPKRLGEYAKRLKQKTLKDLE
jgi:arylsulfatase A-like enzyme